MGLGTNTSQSGLGPNIGESKSNIKGLFKLALFPGSLRGLSAVHWCCVIHSNRSESKDLAYLKPLRARTRKSQESYIRGLRRNEKQPRILLCLIKNILQKPYDLRNSSWDAAIAAHLTDFSSQYGRARSVSILTLKEIGCNPCPLRRQNFSSIFKRRQLMKSNWGKFL